LSAVFNQLKQRQQQTATELKNSGNYESENANAKLKAN